MNKALLVGELAELLEESAETIKDGYLFESSDLWDSLTIVSIVAAVRQYYQVSVSGSVVEHCAKVSDLFQVISDKINSTQ